MSRPPGRTLSRRCLFWITGGAAGAVALTTAGQTFSPLEKLALLSPRRPSSGPQGVPVNKTAEAAGVLDSARDPGWRLSVDGPRPYSLTLAELQAMPQQSVRLPITCVEGWSSNATWTGVRVRDLVDRAGGDPDHDVRVDSLEQGGPYRSSVLGRSHARDALTLVALQVNGEQLDIQHGYPARLIAPNRPGVLQTKWLTRVVAL